MVAGELEAKGVPTLACSWLLAGAVGERLCDRSIQRTLASENREGNSSEGEKTWGFLAPLNLETPSCRFSKLEWSWREGGGGERRVVRTVWERGKRGEWRVLKGCREEGVGKRVSGRGCWKEIAGKRLLERDGWKKVLERDCWKKVLERNLSGNMQRLCLEQETH